MSGIVHSWPFEIDFNRAQIRSRIKETDILDFKPEASYIVFTDGSKYYAKNGDSGTIEFTDTDISNLLQNAINTLYSKYGGGRIFIKRGTYYPTKTITIPDGINLIIEGEGNNTVFRYTSQFNLFKHAPSNPSWTSIIVLRSFKVDRSGSGSNNTDVLVIWYAKLAMFDNIEVVDDYRTADGDEAINANNNIVAIAQNCRVFNKSYGIWVGGHLSIARGNYVYNTAKVGVAGAGLLSNLALPPGYSAGGVTIIEDNICVDCGRVDEAIAVDYGPAGKLTEGLGIIRNNLVMSQNYSVTHPINALYVSHAVVEGNKVYGSVVGSMLGTSPSDTGITYLVVRNNAFNVTANNNWVRPSLYAKTVIVENNELRVNSAVSTDVLSRFDVKCDYLVFRGNRIIITTPSGYYSEYVLYVTPLGNTDFYAVIENNYIDAPVSNVWTAPIEIYSSASVNHYIWFMKNYVKSTTNPWRVLSVAGNNNNLTFYVLYRDNIALGALPNKVGFRNDTSGYTTTGIIDTDALAEVLKNAVIKYMKRNSGVATFSGDGATTQFKIAHGLASTPSKVIVTPGSSDAKGSFYVTADSTYIYVNYSTAPPSGTNNVVLYWYAEV